MAQMEELIQLDDHVVMGRSLDADLTLLPDTGRENEFSPTTKTEQSDLLEMAEAITTFLNLSEQQQQQMFMQESSTLMKSKIENKTMHQTEPFSVLNDVIVREDETANALSFLIEGQYDFKALNAIAAKDFTLVAWNKRSVETSIETNWGERQGKYRRVKNNKIIGEEKPSSQSFSSKTVLRCNSICSPTHHPKFAFGGKYRPFSYVELQLKCADEE